MALRFQHKARRGSDGAVKPMLPWPTLRAAVDELEEAIFGDLAAQGVPPHPIAASAVPVVPGAARGSRRAAREASLFARVFAQEPHDSMGDDFLAGRAHMLRWASPEDVGVPEGARNPVVVGTAAAEIRAMARCRSPATKMAHLDKAVDVLARAVSLARRAAAAAKARARAEERGASVDLLGPVAHDASQDASADDLVPSLSLAFLRSGLEAPYSELLFMDRFRDEDRMLGRAGWVLATAQMSLSWLESVKPSSFGISDEEFRRRAMHGLSRDGGPDEA